MFCFPYVSGSRRNERLLLKKRQGAGVRGRETTDAVLAALAIGHGATLVSTDLGFRRFPELRWLNPLA